MVRSRQGTIWDSISIYVFVTRKPTQFLQLGGVEHLAAANRLFRVLEGLRHPAVHAQIEVRENKDRSLQLLGKIEGFNGKFVTFLHRRRQQHHVDRKSVV